MSKPIYKLVDSKGRVLIPKALRETAHMEYGDIVRIGLSSGRITVTKVDIVEVGDQSSEAVEAYVKMKQGSFSFARRMLGMPCKRFPLKPVKLHGAESRM